MSRRPEHPTRSGSIELVTFFSSPTPVTHSDSDEERPRRPATPPVTAAAAATASAAAHTLTQRLLQITPERIKRDMIRILNEGNLPALFNLVHDLKQHPTSSAERTAIINLIQSPELNSIWIQLLEVEGPCTEPGKTFKLRPHRVHPDLYGTVDPQRLPSRHHFDILAGIHYYYRTARLGRVLMELRNAIRAAQKNDWETALRLLQQAITFTDAESTKAIIQELAPIVEQAEKSASSPQQILQACQRIYAHYLAEHKSILAKGEAYGCFLCMEGLFEIERSEAHAAREQGAELSDTLIASMQSRAQRALQMHWSMGHLLAAQTHDALGQYYAQRRNTTRTRPDIFSARAGDCHRSAQQGAARAAAAAAAAADTDSAAPTLRFKQLRDHHYQLTIMHSKAAAELSEQCEDLTHNIMQGETDIRTTTLYYYPGITDIESVFDYFDKNLALPLEVKHAARREGLAIALKAQGVDSHNVVGFER